MFVALISPQCFFPPLPLYPPIPLSSCLRQLKYAIITDCPLEYVDATLIIVMYLYSLKIKWDSKKIIVLIFVSCISCWMLKLFREVIIIYGSFL
jgi:hypothetical protein